MGNRKKYVNIGIAIIIGSIIGIFLCVFLLSNHGFGISRGYCLVGKDGSYFLVLGNSPIVMSNQSRNKKLFTGLENGDEILVIHDGIQESYPGRTGVYAAIKLNDGDLENIPQEILIELEKLGWIDTGINLDEQADEIQKEVSLINPEGMTVETRIITPEGYIRLDTTDDENFTSYVRDYPVKEDGASVLLYNGAEKRNQSAHVAVLALPIEEEDLQQCADSIMRIYAEYYYATGQYDKIKFHFVNGFLAEYSKWREGYRISFNGNNAAWVQSAGFDDSYVCFQKFMRIVFSYAGTLSMENESIPISLEEARVGDVFLKGGSPGHVVMILDVCENEEGERAYLLAQGYMPAQEFHVLKNPLHEGDPWYYEKEITYPLQTPEYTFQEGSLKRLNYE